MTTAEIFEAVLDERHRQDVQFGPGHDDGLSEAEWVALITRQAGLALDDGCRVGDPDRFERQMVRVGALAMAALQARHRRGLAEPAAERLAGSVSTGSGY